MKSAGRTDGRIHTFAVGSGSSRPYVFTPLPVVIGEERLRRERSTTCRGQ